MFLNLKRTYAEVPVYRYLGNSDTCRRARDMCILKIQKETTDKQKRPL